MGGYSANKTRKLKGDLPARRVGADPCDLQFRVDLVGVISEVSRRLDEGEILDVAIATRGAVKSVVCRRKDGDVVGTLAAFKGLAQLISCIRDDHTYVAYVEASSRTRCSVLVMRQE